MSRYVAPRGRLLEHSRTSGGEKVHRSRWEGWKEPKGCGVRGGGEAAVNFSTRSVVHVCTEDMHLERREHILDGWTRHGPLIIGAANFGPVSNVILQIQGFWREGLRFRFKVPGALSCLG